MHVFQTGIGQKPFVFKAFWRFPAPPKWADLSIKFASKTRFSDLNFIGLFSENAIKINVFLTILHCIKMSFILTSSFSRKSRKRENVEISLVLEGF